MNLHGDRTRVFIVVVQQLLFRRDVYIGLYIYLCLCVCVFVCVFVCVCVCLCVNDCNGDISVFECMCV